MPQELINRKIQEIFNEYAEANNITVTRMDSWDEMRLDQIKEALCRLVVRVGNGGNHNEDSNL